MNLFDTIKLVASLVFAIPPAIVGFDFFVTGEPLLGIVFLGLAALMLLLPEYIERKLGQQIQATLGKIPLFGRKYRD